MLSIDNLMRHVKILSEDIGSRSLAEPASLDKTRDYIQTTMDSYGYHIDTQEFSACGVKTANVLACHKDWNPRSPSLLLGAHYDTVSGTPGADDNASGVSVLLETARILSLTSLSRPPEVVFAAFSAEEPPAFETSEMGSRVFARSLKEREWDIRGALIMEMVGYFRSEPGSQDIPIFLKLRGYPDRGDFIMVVGIGMSRDLVEEVAAGIERSGDGLPVQTLVVPGSGYLLPEIRLSDNASFWDIGVPAVMITDTSFYRNPHYHRFSDRMQTLDFDAMGKLTMALCHIISRGQKPDVRSKIQNPKSKIGT